MGERHPPEGSWMGRRESFAATMGDKEFPNKALEEGCTCTAGSDDRGESVV